MDQPAITKGEMSNSPNTVLQKEKHRLIVFATSWGSKFGGINSFNADFLRALSIAFQWSVQVVCIVLESDPSDVADAAKDGVTLLDIRQSGLKEFNRTCLSAVTGVLSKANITVDNTLIWLGHDRITGEIAVHAAESSGGRSAVIHHMSYAHYEAYAETARAAEAKVARQRAIFSGATFLFAIGPILADALVDMVHRSDVCMLVPGMPEIVSVVPPKTFTGFLSGRISSETHKIKQAHLGIAGFSNAVSRCTEDANLPSVLKFSSGPGLKVRGIEESGRLDNDAENELKRLAEEYAHGVINLWCLPFTTNRDEIFEEVRSSSVALMPSWHEGFGLVAWEAIAAGVPVILTKKSGVYRLLETVESGMMLHLVFGVDVKGQVESPFFRKDDLRTVSDAVIQIAKEPVEARLKASKLRERLFKLNFTWKRCAEDFMSALGWQDDNRNNFVSVTHAETLEVGERVESDPLLELPRPQWRKEMGLSDSQLLRAEEAIVPFYKSALPFLNQQIEWAENEDFPISLRLVIGVGGSGKTRLALQLCVELAKRNWLVGFLRENKDAASRIEKIVEVLRKENRDALIVVDYAEARQSDIISLLRPLIDSPGMRVVRILLLARGGGEWWNRMEGADPRVEGFFAGNATSGPFEIPAFYDTLEARQFAFQESLAEFAQRLGKEAGVLSPDLSSGHYARPLMVQMAALLALHDEKMHTAESLTRALINHERRYWRALFGGRGGSEDQAAQIMALSTLLGGLRTSQEVENIWKRAQLGKVLELRTGFAHLRTLYPERTGLPGMRPDLLGEALVTQVLLSGDGHTILEAIFEGVDSRSRQRVLTVLARVLRHRDDMRPMVLRFLISRFEKLALDAIEVSRQTASPLPELLELAYEQQSHRIKGLMSPRILQMLDEDNPLINDLSLRVSEAMVSEARANVEKASSKGQNVLIEQSSLASALGGFSIDLSRTGQFERALEVGEEAQEIYERLEKQQPLRFRKGLASIKTNNATRLIENGRSLEALEMAREGLELQRKISSTSVSDRRSLAICLNNYGNRLSDHGRANEALAASEEATAIYRQIATEEPEAFESSMAFILENHGYHLAVVGDRKGARAVVKEALEICERLAANRPGFEHSLAKALNNYAIRLVDDSEISEALTVSERSLKIFERLAKSKPQRFEQDWLVALHNHALRLDDCGFYSEGLDMALKALNLAEQLSRSNSSRFEPPLARALEAFAIGLEAHGQFAKALEADARMIGIYRRLKDQNPRQFELDLGRALARYAWHYGGSRKFAEASDTALEAKKILEPLVERLPLPHAWLFRECEIYEHYFEWAKAPGESKEMVLREFGSDAADYTSRPWRGALFSEFCVRACLSAAPADRLRYSQQANDAWATFDIALKSDLENWWLIAVAILAEERNEEPWSSAEYAEWRDRLSQGRIRRGGSDSGVVTVAVEKLRLKCMRIVG